MRSPNTYPVILFIYGSIKVVNRSVINLEFYLTKENLV